MTALESIPVPDGAEIVAAFTLPMRVWCFAARVPAVPPRKGMWEWAGEDRCLETLIGRYAEWLDEKGFHVAARDVTKGEST